MGQTNEGIVATSKYPPMEISYLIRSSEDAMRLAETLRFFCIDTANNEGLPEADELISLVQHWDAPLTQAAWARISDLCSKIRDVTTEWGDGEDPAMYEAVAHALSFAAERKNLSELPSPQENGDESQ